MQTKHIVQYLFSLILILLILSFSYILISHNSENIYSAKTKTSSITKESKSTKTDMLNRINTYLIENNIDSNCVGISIYDFQTKQSYGQNEDINFTSASLYKVPLAMLYYEYVAEGSLNLEDTLVYGNTCYEEGGPIGYAYQVGDAIRLDELLYDMIVYSDNTAGHILFENLGGWEHFRTLIQKYSNTTLNTDAINYNECSTSFANDILIYAYEHPSIYNDLIAHMKLVYPNDYLNKNLGITIAQKYGSYNSAENAMGIVFATQPYAITITTTLGAQGIQIIGDLNEIIYPYFNINET